MTATITISLPFSFSMQDILYEGAVIAETLLEWDIAVSWAFAIRKPNLFLLLHSIRSVLVSYLIIGRLALAQLARYD